MWLFQSATHPYFTAVPYGVSCGAAFRVLPSTFFLMDPAGEQVASLHRVFLLPMAF